jgi:uncharacterized protein (TIGR02231 family)
MKKLTTILSALLFSVSLMASLPQTKLNTKIEGVTVYLNGASITRIGQVSLEPGMREILISGLSPHLAPSSIQVGGTGDFILLSVSSRINYIERQIQLKEVKALQDSLKSLNKSLMHENAMLYVYQQEEKMLNLNQSIGGDDKGVDAQQLMAAVDYFRKRMIEIKKLQIEASLRLEEIHTSIERINNQLAGMQEEAPPVGEIILLVQVENKTQASFKISYLVNAASWSPSYDIRVKDIKTPPEITFKATIEQRTGEDWKDVKLNLSTADPSVSNTLPVINPWYLSYQRPMKFKTSRNAGFDSIESFDDEPATMAMHDVVVISGKAPAKMGDMYNYTQTYEAGTNIEYQITLPYSLEPTGKQLTIEVARYTLDATYTYYAVPKIDKDAFLKARVTGWEKYNFLPAQSNIYFEGTLVGSAFVNAIYATDTLELSLGRDKRIMIERIAVKDVSNRSIIGSTRKDTHVYEIKIRNNKKEDISLIIEDQIPLSKSSEIVVDKLEDNGATFNPETGTLKWELKLAGAETKSLRFGFSVKYPKDQVLYIR